MSIRGVLILSVGVWLIGCGSDEAEKGEPIRSTTLAQEAGAASPEECANGGIHLEHGVDGNGDGVLDPTEVSTTYTLCNGINADSAAVEQLTAEVTQLRQDVAALQMALEATAQRSDLATVATSGSYGALADAPATITAEQAEAITVNSSKNGISAEQAGAITSNSEKVGVSAAQADAIAANSA